MLSLMGSPTIGTSEIIAPVTHGYRDDFRQEAPEEEHRRGDDQHELERGIGDAVLNGECVGKGGTSLDWDRVGISHEAS